MANEEIKDRALLKATLKKILGYIQNGITDGDTVRKFNLLDYYMLISDTLGHTKLDLYDCYKKKIISYQQFEKINRFVNTRLSGVIPSMNIQALFQITFRRGDWVMNEEEKKLIIGQLAIKGIPINNVTYVIAANRYILENVPMPDNLVDEPKTRKRVQ